MTAQPRGLSGRSLPAGLLGVLAVLASLMVLPGSAAAAVPSPSAAPAAARGAAPFGAGLRETRDKARVVPRRLSRQPSVALVAADRSAGRGHGPAPVAGVLTAAALTGLGVVVLVAAGRSPRPSRRTPGARRDRAPPALALA